MAMRALWGELARRDTQMHRRMMAPSRHSSSTQPTRPNSSPQTAKISSVWRAGRDCSEALWVWVPLR